MTAFLVPRFLSAELAQAIHDRQLAEHGGLAGIKDLGLLDSAVARPLNKHGYGEHDLCVLAAAYAFGIARNHPFVDGNKRTAWVMARLFLRLNGVTLAYARQRPRAWSWRLLLASCPRKMLPNGSVNTS